MGEVTSDEFQKICMDACERLVVFPAYKFLSQHGKLEYCKWIYQKAQGDEQKVNRLIDELITQFAKLPTIHELAKIWLRLFPTVLERPAVVCGVCHGTGYLIVETEKLSGAERCPQKCPIPDGSYQPAPADRRSPSSGPSARSEKQLRRTHGRLGRPTAKAVSGLLFE